VRAGHREDVDEVETPLGGLSLPLFLGLPLPFSCGLLVLTISLQFLGGQVDPGTASG
jgi:hypothetical protein